MQQHYKIGRITGKYQPYKNLQRWGALCFGVCFHLRNSFRTQEKFNQLRFADQKVLLAYNLRENIENTKVMKLESSICFIQKTINKRHQSCLGSKLKFGTNVYTKLIERSSNPYTLFCNGMRFAFIIVNCIFPTYLLVHIQQIKFDNIAKTNRNLLAKSEITTQTVLNFSQHFHFYIKSIF